MIRTSAAYRQSIRADRDIHVAGERVADVTTHPAFRGAVDLRGRIHDLSHDPAHRAALTLQRGGEVQVLANALPYDQADWWAKRRASDRVMEAVGGIALRSGDETLGEMWSLLDAAPALSAIDPRFDANIARHVARVVQQDLFHVTASTDPKGNRALPPEAQADPDMRLHVLRETDAGLILRGAKFVTAAPYANQAFVKPALAQWGDTAQSAYAVGVICDLNAPGLRFVCRSPLAGRVAPEDAPLAARFDEIEALVIFDDVLVPWEDVIFYRHVRSAQILRASQHRYSAFGFVQRLERFADLLIGVALFNLRQTGLDGHQGVQEKLAQLAVWREGINAHLTAAITLAEASPGGLMMPNQSLLYAGRVLAVSQLPAMIHLARELCGGQIGLTPDAASFAAPETAPWLAKYYTLNPEWQAEDRRRLMAFAHDLIVSDHAGHRLCFQQFAQGPGFAHLAAVYRNFDWDGPLALVQQAAGLSDRVLGPATRRCADSDVSRWFSTQSPRSEPRYDPA